MRMLGALTFVFAALPLFAADPPPAPPAQPILTYQEVTTNGGQPQAIAGNVVDINSRVNVLLNKAALDARIPKALNLQGLDPNIAARISLLSSVLKDREQNLQQLKTAFSQAQGKETMSSEELKSYYSEVQKAASGPASLIRASRRPLPGSIFKERFDEYFNHPPAGLDPKHVALDQYAVTFMAATDDLAKLQQDLEASASQNAVYVRLGAWVQDRPQHLAGFDTLQPGQHFVVERFNLQLTDAQKEELKNLAVLSKNLNDEGISAISLWKQTGKALIEGVVDKSNTATCIRTLKNTLTTDRSEISSATTALQQQYDDAKTKVDAYVATLEKLKTSYSDGGTAAGMPADQFLIQTNDDMVSLVDDTKQLATDLRNAATTMTAIAAGLTGQAKTDLTNLAAAAKSCADTAEADLKQWRANIVGAIDALRTGTDFDRAALQFSDAVSKLDIDKVPDNTFLPLTYTGPRQRGDALTFKLAAGTPNGPEVQLEEGDFVLFQTLPYITLKVGLIFAHPTTKAATDTTTTTTTTTDSTDSKVRHFQTAPAYSVLFKKDSPTRMWWNTLFDPGIGVNLSALDFNHDDTPELGAGPVVSLFRDIVQVGAGYNIPLGKKYWFFGLRLPFPTLTMNGAQTSTTQTTTTTQ